MSKLNWRHGWPFTPQRRGGGWQDPGNPEAVVRKLEAVNSGIEEIKSRLDRIDAKLDRMWHHIDMIRTHAAAYIGNGITLTYLPDQTPILVNSDDYYGPLNLINGGHYEEENVELLFSFVGDDTLTFVDVGANLGFFSLKLGKRMRQYGKVLAFEPHPKLVELIRYNAIINGLEPVVTIHPHGLSDSEEECDFRFPKGHLGGGVIGDAGDDEGFEVVRSRVRRLDDVLDPDTTVDLMKIDVEGREPSVLRGMQQIMARSPKLKILFEKLGTHVGHEAEIESLLRPFGFQLYGVTGMAQLSPLAEGELAGFSGCAFAAHAEQVDALDRRRFSIYPSQLSVPDRPPPQPGEVLIAEGPPGQTLFYGPYWFLRRGAWMLNVHGKIEGDIVMHVAERYGYVLHTQRMSARQMQWQFRCDRDVLDFELVARPVDRNARVEIERLELVRL
jgi:FkbM family methyltransferase